jgi:hypothetical protein
VSPSFYRLIKVLRFKPGGYAWPLCETTLSQRRDITASVFAQSPSGRAENFRRIKKKPKVAGPVEGTQPYHRGRNRNWHDQYGVRHSLRRSDGCSDYFRERHRRSLIVYIFCVNACLRGEGDTADLHGRRVATSRRRP